MRRDFGMTLVERCREEETRQRVDAMRRHEAEARGVERPPIEWPLPGDRRGDRWMTVIAIALLVGALIIKFWL